MSNFQLHALDHEPFAHLFDLDNDALAAMGIRRMTARSDFGYPCRVSLQDAAEGEELLLLPYQHQPADSPYRASGPIFVRRGATQKMLAPGDVPPYITRRLMSLRAYDANDMMVRADVVDGEQVAERLQAWFDEADVAYVHLHNARPGCFSSLALRA
jgi:hypothetical protein